MKPFLPEHAIGVGNRILQELAAPFVVKGHRLQIAASIGTALFPRDATACTALLRHADIAMYRAKHAGGSRFEFFLPPVVAEVA